MSEPVVIDVGPNVPDSPRLVGQLFSQLHNDDVDPLNISHWRQVRVNGGAWQDVGYVKNVAQGRGGGGGWSTIGMPLEGITTGENVIEFRFAARPPEATWQWNGFRVKDLEIQTEDRPLVSSVSAALVDAAQDSSGLCSVPVGPRVGEAFSPADDGEALDGRLSRAGGRSSPRGVSQIGG